MTTSDSDQPSSERDIPKAYQSFKHNAALAMLVTAPILIAIPPRKLDLYTFSLAGAFVASVNQLSVERTGRGLIGQAGYRYRIAMGGEKVEMENRGGKFAEKSDWLASVDEDWKRKRLLEEQEKLDEGEGYGGMIMDQIWDVWNQEGKKGGMKRSDTNTNMEKEKGK